MDSSHQLFLKVVSVDHNRFKTGVVKAPHPEVKNRQASNRRQNLGAH